MPSLMASGFSGRFSSNGGAATSRTLGRRRVWRRSLSSTLRISTTEPFGSVAASWNTLLLHARVRDWRVRHSLWRRVEICGGTPTVRDGECSQRCRERDGRHLRIYRASLAVAPAGGGLPA